ncbi:MAG TPA: pitrilysin family protein [Longimicrobiales bacterium]
MKGSFLGRLPTHEHRLDNGLTVLVREDRSAPVVAIVAHVRAGYFNEPDAVVGISHVLEHMVFKGTERLGPGELARATKAVGGYLNAGTIYDYTTYYTVLPSAALERGLEIQAEALSHAAIDPDELRRELEVIIQEARRKLDNPRAVATEALYELMFDVHRMRRWRIGREAELRRLTREDVWRYYQDFYRPSNIVLVVAGDVDPRRTLELVERCYGGMPPGESVSTAAPEEPERRGLRFREMAGDVVRTSIEWGWRTPGTLHPDTPALDLLAVVLGQGRASRLFQRVRETGRVTRIGASNYTPTEIGVFGVSAEALPADTPAAIEATWREVAVLAAETVSSTELDRARNVLEARMLQRLETVEGQARLLAEWQALGDWRLADGYLARLFAATPDDLRRVARRYLTPERAALLVYRPESAEPVGAPEVPSAKGVPRGRARTEQAQPATRTRSRTPPGGPAVAAGFEDGVHFYELANGVRIAIKPRRTTPLVSMGILARGGALDEQMEQAGITGLLARTSVKGTTTRSGARIAEEVEAMGGAVSATVASDAFGWTLSVPARHFADAFAVLADVALRPSFPEAELERERKVALSDLNRLRDDMRRYPLRLLFQGAFPDHPYGFPAAVTEAALGRATRADLTAWHRARVLETPPLVVVVGDVDPDVAASGIAREMEPVRGGRAEGEGWRPAWPEGPRVEVEHRTREQTALALGFPGPARNDPDAYALDVLANVLSGLGGRLFEALRERRALAYTVTASPVARWCAGAFVSYVATSPEREDEARHALLEELARVADESIGADELSRAQEYTIGAWKIRSQANAAQLGDLADALLLGRGLSELREFEARIRALTPVALREAARRWFDPNRIIEGVVRGSR